MKTLRKEIEANAFLGLMGDVMIGRLVNTRLSHEPPAYIWGNILPLLKATDCNLINLETTLTVSSQAASKVFTFKADPTAVRSLVEGSIDAVNLANNHILDFSEEGLEQTIQTLDAAGIIHVGAGIDYTAAIRPAIISCNNLTIGILGCTDNEPTWEASATTAGTVFLKELSIDPLRQAIAQLKKQVDIVILTIHWGPNMKQKPSSAFINFAHEAIDDGVDIIHGHSAHIFQGIESYKNGIILYDTGDFVDDYAVDPYLRNDRSFFFLVEIGKQGVIALYLIPVRIDDCQVNVASGNDFDETVLRMQRVSEDFHTHLTVRQIPFPHLFLRLYSPNVKEHR